MTKREKLERDRKAYLRANAPYKMEYWEGFDYSILEKILWLRKSGRGDNSSYNDCIIMGDTETSKKDPTGVYENHVVAWTISIRCFSRNLVTLWGRKPSDMMQCISQMLEHLQGEITYMYFHNLAYDWVFLRRFFFDAFGFPERQLNTKPHYPIFIKFNNGLILRDSLILAQRSLGKWASDMDVRHQKEIGSWDYDKLRGQEEKFSKEELRYIEHDTLAGVECIDATRKALNKRIFSMPYTATGIPREEVRKRGKEFHAHDWFLRMAPTYEQQLILELLYHGGYTHANRHIIGETIYGSIICYDFASSYPFVLLSEKYPCERFIPIDDTVNIQYILDHSENYAYMFKLTMMDFKLKDDFIAMPALQLSKCQKSINLVSDNGRVLCGRYAEIYLNEQDLAVIASQYDIGRSICSEVQVAKKDYLPRWLTDYVYQLFIDKQQLKGGDPVLYALYKAKLNSIYGLTVQKPVRDTINEDYETGEYIPEFKDLKTEYEAYLKRQGSVLPYFIGVWVTSYAMRNLFTLGDCIDFQHGGLWLYSDTDSIYSNKWDQEKVDAYNQRCKDKLQANGYGAVRIGDKEYWLGVAAKDKEYTEFRTSGSKRYCGRDVLDGKLHITVAGVPKKGAECLNDDISNFTTGFIFAGSKTGKKLHTYFYNEIYTDDQGNETGDSIDLSPCDYLLDSVEEVDWAKIFEEEVLIQTYEETE